jgi:hypothetical protein
MPWASQLFLWQTLKELIVAQDIARDTYESEGPERGNAFINRRIDDMNDMTSIAFHNDTLFILEHEGEPYTPMRPIVEGMGLAWKPQFQKLMDHKKRWGVTILVTQLPGDIQRRDVTCMPIRKLPGFLATVSPNKVRPEIRDRIIAYQDECDEVLWRHWTQGHAQNDRGASRDLTRQTKLFALLGLTRARYGHGDIGYNVVSMNVAQVLLYFLEEEPDMEDGWFVRSCEQIGRKAGMTRNATYKALRHAVSWGFVERRAGGWPAPNRVYWHRLDPQLARDYADAGLRRITVPLAELQVAALPQ